MGGGPFKRSGRGVLVTLGADERAVLARLLGDVHTMLGEGGPDAEDDAGPDGGTAPAKERDPLADIVGVDDDWLADVAAGVEGLGEPLDERPAAERFDDPALARLLPDGDREDPKAAAEFRRLTEAGLRHRKRASLARARDALGRPEPVVLDAEEAQALLKGLTDVRLVIAERLGLKTDEDAEMVHAVLRSVVDPEEPWVVMAALYDELSWWQESLIRALPR